MQIDLTRFGIELSAPAVSSETRGRRRSPWQRASVVLLLVICSLLSLPVVIEQSPFSSWEERNSRRLSDRPSRFDSIIQHYAQWYGLDPALLAAVIQTESSFNPLVVSNKGALGLMQLMPETAASWQVSDPMNPHQNIRGGALQLRYLLVRFQNNLELALAAYHAGETRVNRYEGIPPSPTTQQYVEKVLQTYRRLHPITEAEL